MYIIFFFNQYFYQVYIKLAGVTKYCDLLTSYDLINDFQVNEPISSCRIKCIYCFGVATFCSMPLERKDTDDLVSPTPNDPHLGGLGKSG